jgi:hypothetical protein
MAFSSERKVITGFAVLVEAHTVNTRVEITAHIIVVKPSCVALRAPGPLAVLTRRTQRLVFQPPFRFLEGDFFFDHLLESRALLRCERRVITFAATPTH